MNLEAWLERCEAMRLTLEETMLAIDHWRATQRTFVFSSKSLEANPELSKVEASMQANRETFNAIASRKDWENWRRERRKEWSWIFDKPPSPEVKKVFTAWLGDTSQAVKWLSSADAYKNEWEGMVENAEDVQAYARQHQVRWSSPLDEDADEKSHEDLRAVVDRAGLSWIAWPQGGGRDLAQACDVLSKAHVDFQHITGSKSSVMGLGNRVSWFVADQLLLASSGYCSEYNIVTSALYPTGPVSHEWLHALDTYLEERPDFKRRVRSSEKALHGLMKQRTWSSEESPYASQEEEREVLRRALSVTYQDRLYGPRILGWVDNPKIQSWDDVSEKERKLFAKEVKQDWAAQGRSEDMASSMMAVVLTHLDLHFNPVPHSKPWVEFCHRYAEKGHVLSRMFGNEEKLEIGRDYFKSIEEMRAHSFEAVHADTSISDVQDFSLRYPIQHEKPEIKQAWAAYMEDLKPLFEEWPDPLLSKNNVVSAFDKLRHKNKNVDAKPAFAMPMAARTP